MDQWFKRGLSLNILVLYIKRGQLTVFTSIELKGTAGFFLTSSD